MACLNYCKYDLTRPVNQCGCSELTTLPLQFTLNSTLTCLIYRIHAMQMLQGTKTNIYIRIALHVNCLCSPELPFTVAKLRFASPKLFRLSFTSLHFASLLCFAIRARVVNGRVTLYLSRLYTTQNNRDDLPCCPCRTHSIRH